MSQVHSLFFCGPCPARDPALLTSGTQPPAIHTGDSVTTRAEVCFHLPNVMLPRHVNITFVCLFCSVPFQSAPFRMKNLLDVAVASMVWWSFGFAIAYGRKTESGSFNQFFGPGSFFTNGEGFVDETGYYGTAEGYNWAFWLFQVCASARLWCSQGATSRPTHPRRCQRLLSL